MVGPRTIEKGGTGMSVYKREKIVSLAYDYLRTNGPAPAKAISEWISSQIKNGVSTAELTNYIRTDERFRALETRRFRTISGRVSVWGVT